MIRKILLVAAAIAMPVGMVAATGSTAFAGSKPPPDPAVNCGISGASITFASPGLTAAGTLTASKTETTSTTGLTLVNGSTTCSGSSAGNSIVSKTGSCKTEASEYPVCSGATKTEKYAYDSVASFSSSSSTSAIAKSLKSLSLSINGISYVTKTKSATAVTPGAGNACGASEAGFQINGVVSTPSNDKNQTATAVICLGTVKTGVDTAGQAFLTSLGTLEGNSAATDLTVNIDSATSSVAIG
jgi:hypothetical protein